MEYSFLLEKLIAGEDLDKAEAKELMMATISGDLTPAQVAAWLIAMRVKKETSLEIGTFASVMRAKACNIKSNKVLIDTCGTGGDKSNLINVSTLSAMTLAAMGHKVAKHGNRSISSKSGSADLLELLGYPLTEKPGAAQKRLDDDGFIFMFAPGYHPAMKHAIGPRKELKVRTVFNILGPLLNPANADIQILGVYEKELLDLMVHSLRHLGISSALVVHSKEGLDEISPLEETEYRFLNEGIIKSGNIKPNRLQLSISSLDEVKAENAEKALSMAHGIIDGSFIAGAEIVALNVTAVLYLIAVNQKNTSLSLNEYLIENVASTIDFIQGGNISKVMKNWSS